MRFRSTTGVALAAFFTLAVGLRSAHADETRKPLPAETAVTPQQGRRAVERGLDFLQQDAAKWRKERECSTCHHGTMTVFALCEAKSQGYEVAEETLKETVKWTKDRLLERIDNP